MASPAVGTDHARHGVSTSPPPAETPAAVIGPFVRFDPGAPKSFRRVFEEFSESGRGLRRTPSESRTPVSSIRPRGFSPRDRVFGRHRTRVQSGSSASDPVAPISVSLTPTRSDHATRRPCYGSSSRSRARVVASVRFAAPSFSKIRNEPV